MRRPWKLVSFVMLLALMGTLLSAFMFEPILSSAQRDNLKYEVVLPQAYAFKEPSNRSERLRMLHEGDLVTLLDEDVRPHWFLVEIDEQTPEAFMDEMALHKVNELLVPEAITLIMPLIFGGRYPF